MLYAFMNMEQDYYIHLHGEITLHKAGTGTCPGIGRMSLTAADSLEVLREIGEEKLKKERILIDFTGIDSAEDAVKAALFRVLTTIYSNQNEIYLLRMPAQIKEELCAQLEKANIPIWEEQNEAGEWYCGLCLGKEDGVRLTASDCEKRKKEIELDNLLILLEDAPKGKAFQVKKLIEDGEYSIFYYVYRLALQMVRAGLASADASQNSRICLIPDNQSGEYLCQMLQTVLGVGAKTEAELKKKVEPDKEYYIVRDVIHMFCELNRLGMILAQAGKEISGSICLLDIHTGVGNYANRVSFHTIDLVKGLGYRIKMQKKLN